MYNTIISNFFLSHQFFTRFLQLFLCNCGQHEKKKNPYTLHRKYMRLRDRLKVKIGVEDSYLRVI